jgi:hypothetical protein
LDEEKKAKVIKDFQNIELVINYDLKKKANNHSFANSIVSLDWQTSSTFMIVKDLNNFGNWLTDSIEISVEHLKFLDEKNFLDSKTEIPRIIGQKTSKMNQDINFGNFRISETIKIPQMLLRLFSDKEAFLKLKIFLNKLKFKVTHPIREIVHYVLNLDIFEKSLNDLYNAFKNRVKLQEKDIILSSISRNEEYENLRLNSIRKKEQEKPSKIMKKFNDIIRDISRIEFGVDNS